MTEETLEVLDPSKHDYLTASKKPFRIQLGKTPNVFNPFGGDERLKYELGKPSAYNVAGRPALANTTVLQGAFDKKGQHAYVSGVNFGECCRIFGAVILGNGTQVGSRAHIGNFVKFSDRCDIGPHASICDGLKAEDKVIIRQRAVIGCNVTVGQDVVLGVGAKVGSRFTAGDWFAVCPTPAEVGTIVVQSNYGGGTKDLPVITEFGNAFTCGKNASFRAVRDNGAYKHKYRFGTGALIGESSRFYSDVEFDSYTTIASSAAFNAGVTFRGRGSAIGDQCTFNGPVYVENDLQLGAEVSFRGGLNWRGWEVINFFVLANVEGSGRQIRVFLAKRKDKDVEVMVQAGCFWGTDEDFCKKATDEGKTFYADVIRASAALMRKRHRQRSKKAT